MVVPSSGISFTPREVGDYLVNVYRHGQHIPNSPFKIYVGETEIGNAGKVKVYGKGLSHGNANELNEFFVNTKDAGTCLKLHVKYSSYFSK
jgi:filamin